VALGLQETTSAKTGATSSPAGCKPCTHWHLPWEDLRSIALVISRKCELVHSWRKNARRATRAVGRSRLMFFVLAKASPRLQGREARPAIPPAVARAHSRERRFSKGDPAPARWRRLSTRPPRRRAA